MNPLDRQVVIPGDILPVILKLGCQQWNALSIYILVTGLAFQRSMAAIRIELSSLLICGSIHIGSHRIESVDRLMACLTCQARMPL